MIESIQFGSKKIEFLLELSERKSLGIYVSPDLQVLVKAPVNSSFEKIKQKVLKRAPWIIKQQNYFLDFRPHKPEKLFISGESHLYMGRQYKLTVTQGSRNEVRYKGRSIDIVTKDKIKAGELMKQWYRQRAKEKFAEIATPIIERFKQYGVEPKSVYIQEMPTRWGSCTPAGKIILNPELIKAPKTCIEYVIIHELCHLVHHYHSIKFFELQTKEMPDWQKWKLKLERLLG